MRPFSGWPSCRFCNASRQDLLPVLEDGRTRVKMKSAQSLKLVCKCKVPAPLATLEVPAGRAGLGFYTWAAAAATPKAGAVPPRRPALPTLPRRPRRLRRRLRHRKEPRLLREVVGAGGGDPAGSAAEPLSGAPVAPPPLSRPGEAERSWPQVAVRRRPRWRGPRGRPWR